ncbi:MAG: hypothetical protein P4L40_08745, partial [Terracidiphilus sp.]|nr:hypothetical protein [Terracidiphilus sp.]
MLLGAATAVMLCLALAGLAGLAAAQKAKISPPDHPEWKDWGLLSSRLPTKSRLTSNHVPDSPKTLQASYPWDNFVEQVGFSEKNLAYGSVLNSHRRYAVSGRGKATTSS